MKHTGVGSYCRCLDTLDRARRIRESSGPRRDRKTLLNRQLDDELARAARLVINTVNAPARMRRNLNPTLSRKCSLYCNEVRALKTDNKNDENK